jgi:hypothetical protein
MRACLAAAFICIASVAGAQTEETGIVPRNQAPKEVLAAFACDDVQDHVMREAFAQGWLWRSKCPGNHANEMAALVFTRSKDGKGAMLVRFPAPKGRATLEALSNAEIFPAAREFNALFVDPEDKRICRTEARWIAKDPVKPRLAFWRETKDCEGKTGWRVLVNTKE